MNDEISSQKQEEEPPILSLVVDSTVEYILSKIKNVIEAIYEHMKWNLSKKNHSGLCLFRKHKRQKILCIYIEFLILLRDNMMHVFQEKKKDECLIDPRIQLFFEQVYSKMNVQHIFIVQKIIDELYENLNVGKCEYGLGILGRNNNDEVRLNNVVICAINITSCDQQNPLCSYSSDVNNVTKVVVESVVGYFYAFGIILSLKERHNKEWMIIDYNELREIQQQRNEQIAREMRKIEKERKEEDERVDSQKLLLLHEYNKRAVVLARMRLNDKLETQVDIDYLLREEHLLRRKVRKVGYTGAEPIFLKEFIKETSIIYKKEKKRRERNKLLSSKSKKKKKAVPRPAFIYIDNYTDEQDEKCKDKEYIPTNYKLEDKDLLLSTRRRNIKNVDATEPFTTRKKLISTTLEDTYFPLLDESSGDDCEDNNYLPVNFISLITGICKTVKEEEIILHEDVKLIPSLTLKVEADQLVVVLNNSKISISKNNNLFDITILNIDEQKNTHNFSAINNSLDEDECNISIINNISGNKLFSLVALNK